MISKQRLSFLFVGVAIICALIWTAYVTGYRSNSGVGSASVRSRVIDLGAVEDPIALDELLPASPRAFSANDLYDRFSPEKWAAVKADALRSIAASPLNSRMWLILALAEVAQHSATESAVAALKMSYFTAPNDVTITEPRLALSLQLYAISDAELKVAVRRDIRNLVLGPQDLRLALISVYCHALPAGRVVIDDLARELEPASAGAWYRAC
jgi:hypothetical protein